MNELDIFQLGKVLKEIDKEYNMEIMSKINLSGGWMTITGKTEICNIPLKSIGNLGKKKSSNVIDIKVLNDIGDGSIMKIIGDKNNKFKVMASETKFRNLKSCNAEEIFINEEETKLRIDEDIIFKIPCRKEVIEKIISTSI